MKAHELARLLLDGPDLPVATLTGDSLLEPGEVRVDGPAMVLSPAGDWNYLDEFVVIR